MSPRPRHPHPDQISLLDWEPSEPVASFPKEVVRAASLAASIARSVSAALKDIDLTREQVAEAMSSYLGEAVGENILNAYASEARAEHIINVVRFIALIHATGDRRLLQLIADPFDWVVIDKDYLDDIELAEVLEARDEINRRADAIRRRKRKSRARRAL